MSSGRMSLYSLMVAVACAVLYLMLSLWIVPNKMSLEDNVIWGIIFGVGLGVGCFCFLKGYQETHGGGSSQPFYAHSPLARKIFRVSQCVATVAWGYYMFVLLTPYAPATVVESLLPLIVVVVLFAASVIVARNNVNN